MIVTPATTTGSSTANGVILPVRPVCTSIDFRSAVRSSGGNLYAIAQRGAWLVDPSRRWSLASSTLITAPSISQSRECRRFSQSPEELQDRVEVLRALVRGGTGSPAASDHARKSECEANVTPSAAPNEWTHIRSGRDCVTFASFCRSEPAAAFAGSRTVAGPPR